jgi:hypothetical protein
MMWIRESGHHVAVNNLYDGSIQHGWFVHPMFLVSGWLWRLGVPLVLSFQLWKPVVVVALVLSYDTFVQATVGDNAGRRASALVLGLFAASPLIAISFWFDPGWLTTDLPAPHPESATWGYLPTVAALALLVLLFVCFDRATNPNVDDESPSRRRWLAWAAVAGFAASWLHPWEGMVGLLVLLALSIWAVIATRSSTFLRTAVVPILATAFPLLYYVVLARLVPSWSASEHVAGRAPTVTGLLLVLGPFALLALLAGRGRDRTIDRVARIWPVAAVGASLTLGTTVPSHFLASVTLPLAVLAVEGWQRLPVRPRVRAAAGTFAVALFTVPGSVTLATQVIDLQSRDLQPHYVEQAEADALSWLDRAPPGSVLASPALATAIPALTGHPTWFGHPNWTPDFTNRAVMAQRLFSGQLGTDEAARLVASTGVQYVLVDCDSRVELTAILPSASVHQFGCASVFIRS